MRPVSVSDEEIIAAGERLLAEGGRVNGYTLRRALGDRGAPKRLNDVWEQHRGTGPTTSPTPSVDLPIEVEAALTKLNESFNKSIHEVAGTIVQYANRNAERRVAALASEAAAAQQLHKEEMEDADATIDEAERKSAALEDALIQSKALCDAIMEERNEARRESAIANQKIADREREVETQIQRVATLEASLRSAEDAREEARREASTANQKIVDREREIDLQAQRITDLEARLGALSGNLAASQEREAQALARLQAAQAQLSQLQVAHDAVSEHLARRNVEIAELTGKADTLRAEALSCREQLEQTRLDMGRQIKLLEQQNQQNTRLLETLTKSPAEPKKDASKN